MIRRRLRPLAAIAVALSLLASGVVGSMSPATAAESYSRISGSGSTWSYNAIDQWKTNVGRNYGMVVDFSDTGSTRGRTDFINQSVDFAVSEIPFQRQPTEVGAAPENPTVGYAYLPIVAGGTSFMYNLKIGGRQVTNLRLSGSTVTRIFTGQIANWNDPAIQQDNPGLAMPDRAIVPVVRSDGSGSSAQFSLWMSKQHGDIWNKGMTSQFPMPANGKAQSGSQGVSGYVSQGYGEGAITYVEYSYALESGFPVAKVLNAAGYYIEPTASSVAVAMLRAQINNDQNSPDYLTQILDGVYNNADPRTYPLSSYSYMIVPTQTTNTLSTAKGRTLAAFAKYVLCEGQQQAEQLGYSPLPMNLVQAGATQIQRIPGVDAGGALDINNCNNPTFRPGDSLESNQLALTAPQPAACDRQGPDQCVTGTAGARGDTAVTGSGSGGAAAGGASGAAAGGGAAGTAEAAAVAADGPVYDANGNLVSGAALGGAVAASSPFTLDDGGWRAPQTLMVVAGVLLLVAIAVPPLLMRRRSKTSPFS